LRARSENGLQVTAKAMRVREKWFDEELMTILPTRLLGQAGHLILN